MYEAYKPFAMQSKVAPTSLTYHYSRQEPVSSQTSRRSLMQNGQAVLNNLLTRVAKLARWCHSFWTRVPNCSQKRSWIRRQSCQLFCWPSKFQQEFSAHWQLQCQRFPQVWENAYSKPIQGIVFLSMGPKLQWRPPHHWTGSPLPLSHFPAIPMCICFPPGFPKFFYVT